MFTGIIRTTGTIHDLRDDRLVIAASDDVDEELGASIAVDGCCLTLTERREVDGAPGSLLLAFDLLPETRSRTRIIGLGVGDVVNLEPALRAGDPLGGHWVQGHVDGVGRVRARAEGADGRWLDVVIEVGADLARYCIERGSITVNGVSLTVMEAGADEVRVQLVPETQARTNLAALRPGDPVNIESDVLARYVERLLPPSS